jgi:predicted DNA-binding transcriptional regulator YafY
MERLVRIAAVLHQRGEFGETGDKLARLAGFDGPSAADLLKRDIRHLTAQGWQIENIAGVGEPARYRMRAIDNRLRLRLTAGQLRALQRAVLLAKRSDLVARLGLSGEDVVPADFGVAVSQVGFNAILDTVLTAVRHRALLHFDYKGVRRSVHPESVRTQNSTWYLRGQEDDDPGGPDGLVKAFVVARMDQVAADDPGTARRVRPARHTGLHPMSWQVDEPVDVTLRTAAAYEPDVRRWLGSPVQVEADGDERVMTYRVTNRAALGPLLYELGRRVQLL